MGLWLRAEPTSAEQDGHGVCLPASTQKLPWQEPGPWGGPRVPHGPGSYFPQEEIKTPPEPPQVPQTSGHHGPKCQLLKLLLNLLMILVGFFNFKVKLRYVFRSHFLF